MTRTLLGMLTPSSNTVVEPTTAAILQSYPAVTAHFARLKVTEISLSNQALAQFETTPFLEAASLLADAQMQVIAWNGTSSAWRGFHEDRTLCQAIKQQFGVDGTASMLALNLILQQTHATDFALVTPYIDEVQQAIVRNYTDEGFHCVAERHLGIKVNFDFSEIDPIRVRQMARDVAQDNPKAIIIVCTNLNSAHLVDGLEQELGIPVYDSTSAVVWHALRLAGIDPVDVVGWGSLFQNSALNA